MTNTSITLGKLTTALIDAQRVFPSIPKTRTAQAGTFSYSYADLSDVVEAIREPLVSNGLTFMQPIVTENGSTVLATRLIHESGEWIESTYPLAQLAKPQEMGSAITYARRYALTSLLGIVTEEDDDGQAASKPKAKSGEKGKESGGGRQGPKVAKPGDSADLSLARTNVVSTATGEGIEPPTAKRLLAGWFGGVSASKDLDEMQCKAAIEGFQNYGKTLREIAELAVGTYNDSEVLLIASGERTDPITSLQELSLDELRGVRDELKLAKAGAK